MKTGKVYLLLILIQMCANVFLGGAVPQAERDALIALYYGTGGDNWKTGTGWLGSPGSENTWYGVTVETINGEDHITKLGLVDNNLTGTIPAELGNLTRLQGVSLDHNNLSGAITVDFSNLASLKRLVLDNNGLTGSIPETIGMLEQLESLGLNHNRLEGNLPGTLGNLRNLEKLRLASNRLTGVIPANLTQLRNLLSLEIDYNGLVASDNGLKAFLDALAPGWQTTQTIAPADVSVTIHSSTSVEVKWTPIVFTAYEGYYEVLYRTGGFPEGEYRTLGKTFDKSAASLVIWDFLIIPGTTYYFAVRTLTFPHGNNGVSVLSEQSPWYECTTAAYTLTVQSEPAGGAAITVIPADIHGEGSGTADFSRTYGAGTQVTLTAAETVNGNPFRCWEIRGGTIDTPAYRREITVVMDSDYSVTAVYKKSEIYFTHTYFNFGGTSGGVCTPAQEFLIGNRGGGTLDWIIGEDRPAWLRVTPLSGTCTGRGSQFVSVSVDTTGLDEGEYQGIIGITAEGAPNSPQEITVTLIVKEESQDRPPMGSFDLPVENDIVSGSTAVCGWALDDIGIRHIGIFREDTRDAAGERVYVGEAVFVEGARPDVAAAYPGYPMNHKAGWGYMMLTNTFHDRHREPRQYKIHAVVTDNGENEVYLGSRTITVNNRDTLKPFGAMDTPAQGGRASGDSYRNRGWVLTPPGNDEGNPKKIPGDGSTIFLYVDGKKIKEGAEYNIFRGDIAGEFPGYANSEGALAYFELDTTELDNGVHAIAWTAEDSAGSRDGIGSRFFTVDNSAAHAADVQMKPAADKIPPVPINVGAGIEKIPVNALNTLVDEPVGVRMGYAREQSPRLINPDKQGIITIEIQPQQRLEIHFNALPQQGKNNRYYGYRLPIGSTMDTGAGIFYWQPGPGFYGSYELIFIKEDQENKTLEKLRVHIRILPG